MMSENQVNRLHAFIEGRVQGVGFRYFVLRAVEDREISGWVRNRRDGRVEVIAEGEQEDLNRLLNDLRKGPINAEVQGVDYEFTNVRRKFNHFRIRATA